MVSAVFLFQNERTKDDQCAAEQCPSVVAGVGGIEDTEGAEKHHGDTDGFADHGLAVRCATAKRYPSNPNPAMRPLQTGVR